MSDTQQAVCLREICREDVPLINEWRRDREMADYLLGTFRHVNEETDQRWFDNYMASRDRNVRLGILLEETQQLIGVVYILNIDWISRSAELGIFIGDRAEWNKGHGTTAVRLAMEHAFNDLNLNRLSTMVIRENSRSAHILMKNGMQEEGVARQAVFKNGEFKDCVHLGLLREDFLRG